MIEIDFNIDAGEGFGNEPLIFPWVSSCNISCASHAGSLEEINKTILLAKKQGLKIGAHPSYPDKINFGRKSMALSNPEFIENQKQQLLLFLSIMEKEQLTIHHIKAHGALYHDIHLDKQKAELFLDTLACLPYKPAIYGLPNSILENKSKEKGYLFIREAFADRAYLDNGLLVPRKEKGSVLESEERVKKQVLDLASSGKVTSINGKTIVLNPETICFHGDHSGAEKRIKMVHLYCRASNVMIR